MKKKSVVALILSFALTGAVLTGCGESPELQQGTQQEAQQETQQGNRQENQQGSQQETQQGSRQETQQGSRQETQQGSQQESQQESQQGTQQESQQGTRQETVAGAADTESTENSTETTAEYEDNFAVDSKAAKEFAEKVKEAAANKDLEALAALTSFPVYVGLPNVNVVESKEDFLKLDAETVFTEELLKSIENADIENLQPSMAGFSVSDGGTANINFGVADGKLAINGINY